MYVRLKHTLSALALEMMVQAPRRRSIGWLRAYVRLAPHGGHVPVGVLRRAAARLGTAGARSFQRLEALGIFERANGRIGLAPEYRAHFAYFARQVERLGGALDALGEDWRLPTRAGALRRGILLFNAGLFFECHEYLEDIWRRERGEDRRFYHGIIQMAAAFYHFEKGNQHGARALLEKAVGKLQPYQPVYLGMHVQRLMRDLQPWMHRFTSLQPGRVLQPDEHPEIRVLEGEGEL